MTPYARRILKLLGVASFIDLVGLLGKFYTKLSTPHLVYWIAAGLLLVLAVAYFYYHYAMGELRDLVFYQPVRRLKHDGKKKFETLGVKTYLDYYRARSDDDAIRDKLKEKRGVLVIGKPLFRKDSGGYRGHRRRPTERLCIANRFVIRKDRQAGHPLLVRLLPQARSGAVFRQCRHAGP